MRSRYRPFAVLLLVAVSVGAILPLPARAEEEATRPAQVAGQFYPDNGPELRSLVQELLDRQPPPARAQKPRLLIVPHAGYQYSGLVAATAFRQLAGHHYDGVVVIGFTHRFGFSGASVDAREAYETPIGLLPVDREAVALLRRHPGIGFVEAAHAGGEHSLEVELPFLQVVLPGVRLVPVIMGTSDWDAVRQLADALADLSRWGDYLFVFSSDLSHYRAYDEARRIDEGTVRALLSETPQAVHRLFRAGRLEACGQGPLVTSLLLAAKLGYLERELLYEANSGDTAGRTDRVVGYASLALYDRPAPPAGRRLSDDAGAALVAAARQSLERTIGPSTPPPGAGSPKMSPRENTAERYPELSSARGLFVTLRKHGELRGCIGRIGAAEPLATAVGHVAADAALRDHRFAPVTAEELPELQVEVSVLTLPVRLADSAELVPGRDGVILEHEGRSGVFLPQVWDETGWTRLEFLRELASQKAGLPPEAWQQATLSVFQDQVFEEAPPDPR